MKALNTALPLKFAFIVVLMLSLTNLGTAQVYRSSSMGTIDAGTNVIVRTNEAIDTKESDGRVYMGVVEQDVKDANNRVAIPRGSDVELVVRKTSDNNLVLDLDSVMIRGQRFGVETEDNVVSSEKEGIGANERTGKYVGGGAIIGAIIGGIAGGGKGAAIGAGAGAAAGAGAQVLTRGGEVKVPAESLLTFRLSEPLRAVGADGGYMSDGRHYHQKSVTSQAAAGVAREKSYAADRPMIDVGPNNDVTWQGPENAKVYVQQDNDPPKLFASGQSGTQAAPWMERGHVYVFMLKDADGKEIARTREDLRNRGR